MNHQKILALALTLLIACGACGAAAASKTLTLPAALGSIEAESFRGDSSLSNVVVPDGIVSIGANAFTDCGALTITLSPTTHTWTGGGADAMSKVFEVTSDDRWQLVFIGLTFVVALCVCAALTLHSKERPCRTDVACGVAMGVLNYLSSEMLLRAVLELPAFIAYTGASLGVIALVNIVNATIMHEPLSRTDRVAMALIAMALVLIYLPLLQG